jgi:hypothetical protein
VSREQLPVFARQKATAEYLSLWIPVGDIPLLCSGKFGLDFWV